MRLAIITAENPGTRVLVYGHSAGGLIVALWLDRVRRRRATAALSLAGLVLNSPWLDLHGPAILRTRLTSTAIGALSRVRKTSVVRGTGKGGYGLTLHREYHGEFEYNLQWKPLGGFPVTFGWIHAIRRGQATLHRGLDVGRAEPDPALGSQRAGDHRPGHHAARRRRARRHARSPGGPAASATARTVVPIRDAKHDVFLSLAEPRAAAYRELADWLDFYLAHLEASAAGRG